MVSRVLKGPFTGPGPQPAFEAEGGPHGCITYLISCSIFTRNLVLLSLGVFLGALLEWKTTSDQDVPGMFFLYRLCH